MCLETAVPTVGTAEYTWADGAWVTSALHLAQHLHQCKGKVWNAPSPEQKALTFALNSKQGRWKIRAVQLTNWNSLGLYYKYSGKGLSDAVAFQWPDFLRCSADSDRHWITFSRASTRFRSLNLRDSQLDLGSKVSYTQVLYQYDCQLDTWPVVILHKP